MTTPDWPLFIGFAAALLTTLAFLPQLVKIKRAGSAELSSTMPAM